MKFKLNFSLPVVMACLALSASYADNGDTDMKPNGCKGVSLCTAYADCIECHNLHLDIGILIEEMRLTNTDFGYKTQSAYNALPQNVEILRPRFNMDVGVKASAGYYFDHDDWFFNIEFEWLRGNGKKKTGTCLAEVIVPTGIWKTDMVNGTTDITTFAAAGSNFKVNYFMLEATLNRASYISKLVAIEPFFGLKSAFLYYNNRTSFDAANCAYGIRHNQKTNFWGIGPEFGVNSLWGLCYDFSFFCDNSIAILFGTSNAWDILKNVAFEATLYTKAHEKYRVMSPVARATIGVQWDRCMCDDTQHMSFKVGLDTQYFWNQYHHIKVFDEVQNPTFHAVDNGSFGMLGILIELGWDF